jgi:hypothetical protein
MRFTTLHIKDPWFLPQRREPGVVFVFSSLVHLPRSCLVPQMLLITSFSSFSAVKKLDFLVQLFFHSVVIDTYLCKLLASHPVATFFIKLHHVVARMHH